MGRAKTGLKRPFAFPVGLSLEENEMLTQESRETKCSKAEILRNSYFKPSKKSRLNEIREALQKQ